jgi:transcriptional regulator with XRE-family HTH domain
MSRTIQSKEYGVIIEKLRQARLDSGLKQIEVAKKLKRPQSYVSKIEAGEQRVDILELKKFAELYKKDVSYFL